MDREYTVGLGTLPMASGCDVCKCENSDIQLQETEQLQHTMAKPEPTEVKVAYPQVEVEEEGEEGADENSGIMEVAASGTELGACGGVSPDQLSESIMDDINDNLSMEVQLGDDGSRHPSEISSISYQTLLEEGESSHFSRRDSEDSNDSYPADDPDADFPPDDIEQFEAADLPLSRIMKETGKLDKSATLKRMRCDDEEVRDAHTKCASGEPKVKIAISGSGDKGKALCEDGVNCHPENGAEPCLDDMSPESFMSETVMRRSRSSTVKSGDSVSGDWEGGGEEVVKKRNSLEIRNNIPTIDEARDVDNNMEDRSLGAQGAKPKIRKQSPGVARRVDNGQELDRSSSERERTPPEDLRELPSAKSWDQHVADRSDAKSDPGRISSASQLQKNMDIENEYDYVKYARVHQGNSYVGMRLAYSSSNDSLSLKRNSMYSQGSDSIQSSRESSPEKTFQHKLDACSLRSSERVSEDLLTEIPLNGSESMGDTDKHSFTLSPDNTECDSQEVESLLSDGDQSNLGMPAVEDGLSSSQASDADDNVPPSASHPTHMLRQKQKDHVEKELTQSQEQCPEKGKEIDAQAIMNDLKAKREALDLAIADIKSAIQRSKGVALQSSYTQEEAEEPVWVMRDNHAQKMQQRQEEMRRVCEEIERLQDDQFAAKQTEQDKKSDVAPEKAEEAEAETGDEAVDSLAQYDSDRDSQLGLGERLGRGESDGGSQPDEASPGQDSALLEASYESAEDYDEASSALDDETRPLRRGYESDDEYEDKEGIRYTRRSKGKKYAPLKKDDSVENGVFRNSNTVRGDMDRNLSIQSLSNTTECEPKSFHLKQEYRDNSEANYSSEELGSDAEPASKNTYLRDGHGDSDTDEETDRLLQKQYQKRDQCVEIPELSQPPVNRSAQAEKRRTRAKEVSIRNPENPEVLIEGVLFRARYLGSTQLVSEGQPSKAMRMMQAQEAVGRIKNKASLNKSQETEKMFTEAPEGENQPSTEVDLFVSTDKIMVLNTDLQEIMMDHTLRTISYIADIGDILVIMARRRLITSPDDLPGRRRRQAKILCHVFESDEAQLIAQSIGQAFQVAYLEFLKANGVEDPGLLKEMDYQDVLNQQEIYGEELQLFTNKDFHKEVIVPKAKNEPLGVVIVESGWGSMVPTVVLANMAPSGPAARCGQLNIGDQIISINGISLVGLPLSNCQTYIKNAKSQTVVKLTVVPCPPVVEVLIKRPDVKYQLGFSVQNGVICSLLRGGIAERGGVRVGHRIIEINNQSVVAVPHEKIVALLANSVGEIHMKTMPTSIFRLLTGQDVPHYL